MFVLDTYHLSLMEWSENAARQQLLERLSTVPPNQVFTTIITYEEQTRGWMAYSAAARTTARQVEAYRKLERHLGLYRRVQALGFDDAAATEFERLKQSRIRIGTMDLKIAAIALARRATVLSWARALDSMQPSSKRGRWIVLGGTLIPAIVLGSLLAQGVCLIAIVHCNPSPLI